LTGQPEPTVIPIPDDFPVEWAAPEQVDKTWIQGRQHAPAPITSLAAWLLINPWTQGSNRGFAEAKQPVKFEMEQFNTYAYNATQPAHPLDQMEAAGAEGERALQEQITTFADKWENEWLPEVKSVLASWTEFDLEAASDTNLLEHMGDGMEKYARLWDIHFQVAPLFLGVPSMFIDLYMELFKPKDELEGFSLIRADHNMSLEVGYALWKLSQQYVNDADVSEPIIGNPPHDALVRLEATESGRNFLNDLRNCLDMYGHRSDGIVEAADPSWTEDPSPALVAIRENMRPNAEDPQATHDRLLQQRDTATSAARGKLETHPVSVRDEFEKLLAAARSASRIQEDHNFWIDQNSLHFMRHIFLEIGKRLAANGSIESAGDVFHLVPDQIREAMASGQSYADIVASDKAEMAEWARVSAPSMIGTEYGPPPKSTMGRALGRFFGTPPPESTSSTEVRGLPVSAGVVRGTARLIMSLRDANRLQRGDILVTPTTAPPWTPLFGIAAAVVTDVGGALSHCGIVSREYGIPCVGGTGNGTYAIKDGQLIEVDGSAGVVRILSDV